MRLLSNNSELSAWRGRVGACIFVPTMGALHEGHASLVRQAAQIARAAMNPVRHINAPGEAGPGGTGVSEAPSAGVIVSIFVNPTQFNDPKDLARYPRTLDADLALCESAGADAVYAPSVEDIYPPGVRIETPRLPAVATMPGLEDAKRPGHFAGVCQVVHRLFTLVRPTAAVFGEKDWQQLRVISAMTRESNLPIEIVPGETVRERDGLAMSSRNRFLSAEDRVKGLSISRALRAACEATSPNQAEAIMRRELELAGVEVEYAVVRDASSLMPIDECERTGRSLIAVRVGPGGTAGTAEAVGGVGVRLIDNAPWHARAS